MPLQKAGVLRSGEVGVMILSALVDQFRQRFQHEKRAQVCLWFDEKAEFLRLLPALRDHLQAMQAPTIRILEYDAERRHGQIWIRHQIHRTLEALPAEERRRQRFVVWLPLAEDRLEHGGPDGEPALDLLAEYRIAGVTWRVDGRRPTLFRFLKQAGVELPDAPGDQRRLYEGGRDSLLAKYVAKFADRPAPFWRNPLSPDLAQSRLIGDVDQVILDLAVSPETTWQDLDEKGLVPEFVALVRERYGFEGPRDRPAAWVAALVAVLALTETFLGYGERADFPLAERLPPAVVRPNHRQLLQRWLRDSESRTAWDRWIQDVEATVDLTTWAQDKPGFCFGFAHLVRMRWRQVAEAFAAASPKSSTTAAFFAEHGELIAREAQYSKRAPALRFLGAAASAPEVRRRLRACHAAGRAGGYRRRAGAGVRGPGGDRRCDAYRRAPACGATESAGRHRGGRPRLRDLHEHPQQPLLRTLRRQWERRHPEVALRYRAPRGTALDDAGQARGARRRRPALRLRPSRAPSPAESRRASWSPCGPRCRRSRPWA